jgi:hypothetical protein
MGRRRVKSVRNITGRLKSKGTDPNANVLEGRDKLHYSFEALSLPDGMTEGSDYYEYEGITFATSKTYGRSGFTPEEIVKITSQLEITIANRKIESVLKTSVNIDDVIIDIVASRGETKLFKSKN